MTMSLTVEPRDAKISARAVRDAGKIPAVVYGPKQEPLSIAVDKMTFEKLFKEAGESTIISLDGLGDKIEVLVKELAFDPKRGGVEHADFYAIERGKEFTTDVALHFIGEAPVEKGGATINKVLTEITITCRPSKLPPHIDVDISGLASEDDHISVADLTIPDGVTVENDATDMVVTVSAARDLEAEEAEGAEAPDMATIGVEEKEGEEAAEAEAN